jgi:hypothetical protein
MKLVEQDENIEEALFDKEAMTQIRAFAELIFDAWKEERSTRTDKPSNLESPKTEMFNDV